MPNETGPGNRTGDSGANYNYSSTSSGQGNWNTGGSNTGTGSMAQGIIGKNQDYGGIYNVAPTKVANPTQNAIVQKQWQDKVNAARKGSGGVAPAGGGGGGGQPTGNHFWHRPAIPVGEVIPPINSGTGNWLTRPGFNRDYFNNVGSYPGYHPGSPNNTDINKNGPQATVNSTMHQTPAGNQNLGNGWDSRLYAGGGPVKPSGYKPMFGGFKAPKLGKGPKALKQKTSKAIKVSGRAKDIIAKVKAKKKPALNLSPAVPKFAKGGAVEKFLQKYPDFKLG